MNEFKVGDLVRCTTSEFNSIELDSEHEVVKIDNKFIFLLESPGIGYAKDFFDIVLSAPFERVPPKSHEFNHSGSKYLRDIQTTPDGKIDVYAVLIAFNVTSPARQHAIKKLLCAGIRGKNNELNDIQEARDAIERDIQLLNN